MTSPDPCLRLAAGYVLPHSPPPPGTPLPSGPRARQRELNRQIAELKIIRLLQTRLDDVTIEVEGSRPKKSDLTPEERREIESLRTSLRPTWAPGAEPDFKLSFARTSGLDRRET